MRTVVTAFLLCLAVLVHPDRGLAQAAAPAIQDPIAAAGFAAEDVGYLVVDLVDGRVLAERNPDRPFIAASVMKIPAVGAALALLGADHRFATTVEAAGEIRDGVLHGTLALRGGGDPYLSSDDLQAMAADLAEAGIRAVDGAFLYDASALVEMPQINALQPEAVGYNPGIGALSVNFNRVRVNWRKQGTAASLSAAAVSERVTTPLAAIGLAFAEAGATGPYVRAGAAGEERWLLSPALDDTGEDWLPVGNPGLITAEVFRALAIAAGVELPPPEAGAAPPGAREIVRHESLPLAEIVRGVMRYSNNLAAELIGLTASRALTKRKLSLADSATSIAAWWQLRLPAEDWTGYRAENHSGLSSASHATPRQIVAMLALAASFPGDAGFHDLLRPITWKGVAGTARVKTGTMSYVRGLAGYIDTASGRRLAFAIFFNDADKRAALDAAFDPHVRGIDPDSRRWRDRALRLEQALTTAWAGQF